VSIPIPVFIAAVYLIIATACNEIESGCGGGGRGGDTPCLGGMQV
jgi:hypothetical protein